MAYPISDVTRRIVYTGSAGVGPYSFTFEVLANTDIQVYKNTTLQTLTTNYTVTINANGTGSVTLVVAATGADTITIVGDRAIQRATDFVTGGDLFANTLNDEFDSLVIFAQQIDEKADRGLKAPVTDPTDVNMVLPVKATRLGTVLAFNATTGNPEVGPLVGDIPLASTYASNAAASASAASTSASSASSSASSASSSAAAAAVSAASGMYSAVQDKSANYTVVVGDAGDLIRVTTTSGAITITLPAISTVSDGFKVAIVKWTGDANAVSVVRSSSDTINGATSYSIATQYNSATFVADFETNQWFAVSGLLGTTTGSGSIVLATSPTINNPTVTNYIESVVAIGTVTSSNTIALTNGTVQTATLTASTACTFTMPANVAGKSFVLLLKQAASTGNGTATFTGVKFGTAGAPTITATAGKMDILTFIADGTNWYGSAVQGYTP
jgi:hypothetical protein